jgi:hypothetical protein
VKPILFIVSLALAPLAQAGSVDPILAGYTAAGASSFDAERGAKLWRQSFPSSEGAARSCGTCHGDDLKQAGKHAQTGKVIEPMAPSANPSRYTDPAKVEKWFERNCKWTLGRVCTDQEKGDLLLFLSRQ